ncbi:hypothetical protein CMV30_08180 [Nibricoccus aquaticus]|uniref:Uncharacterized protein n=1 Tax=Nibricoccus aquaticus TaxID=2576891 RepID=A0A290QHU5_9BACT|nr:hypothetical protein CMV30_08180 [Nibricoccus aquaticus]
MRRNGSGIEAGLGGDGGTSVERAVSVSAGQGDFCGADYSRARAGRLVINFDDRSGADDQEAGVMAFSEKSWPCGCEPGIVLSVAHAEVVSP